MLDDPDPKLQNPPKRHLVAKPPNVKHQEAKKLVDPVPVKLVNQTPDQSAGPKLVKYFIYKV
jgi:hypothetical protein